LRSVVAAHAVTLAPDVDDGGVVAYSLPALCLSTASVPTVISATARNTFSGDLTGVFTYSPIGPVEPTRHHLEWGLINTFRYHNDGRLAEGWVQTDYRSFLTKLGVTTTESARRGTNT